MTQLLSMCVCCCLLAACGDGIQGETRDLVIEKTDEALALYAELEDTVEENDLEVKKAFTDMKKQLEEMSRKVKAQVDGTTEDDGQNAAEELEKIIANLNMVKEKIEQMLSD